MKNTTLTLLFALFICVPTAFAQTDYCFQNDGLRTETSISFKISGNKVTHGEFKIANYDEIDVPPISSFVGTKRGNLLTIKFYTKTPEEFEKIKTIKWTLGKTLKVPMYGKNHQTNKWSVYTATYEKCGNAVPSSDNATKRIVFPKGKSEATESVLLAAGESKKFVISAKTAQIFMVDADSKDIEISMISGKIAKDATLSEPGHFDTTLLADGDFVFEVKNTSSKEVKTMLNVIVSHTNISR